MNFDNLPKNIYSGAYKAGHCQGIATDIEKGFIYYSFTTMLVKTDLDGNFIGSVVGLLGHLGCIVFNKEDGCVYGSLEYKNDSIGRGILNMLGDDTVIPDKFYIAIFDVDKIDRADMPAPGIMKCSYLKEVVDDYSAKVTLADGRETDHRYGCSGIDGCAIGPDFGKADSENNLFVAYGIYSDTSRDDNDHQVILKYGIGELNEKSAALDQNNMHEIGPSAPEAKYFVFTGNTNWGVQNLEYDPFSRKYYMAVYRGSKPYFPNPPMFAADASITPERKNLVGVYPEEEADVISLDEYGTNGYSFDHGDTGIASLGDGYFFVSFHGRDENGQYTNVKLCKLNGNTFDIVE